MPAEKRPLILQMITTIGIVNMLAMPLISHADGHSASIQPGMKIAFDKKKGNCLACHKIEGGVTLADIGPELNNMKQRFPDKSLIRKRIWDETKFKYFKNECMKMIPEYNHEGLDEAVMVLRKEFYGFTNNKLFKYGLFKFKNQSCYYSLIRVFREKKIYMKRFDEEFDFSKKIFSTDLIKKFVKTKPSLNPALYSVIEF